MAVVDEDEEAVEVGRRGGLVVFDFLVDAAADELSDGDALGEEVEGQFVGLLAGGGFVFDGESGRNLRIEGLGDWTDMFKCFNWARFKQ